MKIIVEEIENNYYADVVLDNSDLEEIRDGDIISGEVVVRRRTCHVGVRLKSVFDTYEWKD